MEDEENQASIIKFIEDQIDLREKMESKLQVIMKKIFLKYANEVIDINAPMLFFVIMDKLKQEIITKLIFCDIDQDKTVVYIIYGEKLEDVEFVNEMTISYNNIYQQNLIIKTIINTNHQYPARKVKRKTFLVV